MKSFEDQGPYLIDKSIKISSIQGSSYILLKTQYSMEKKKYGESGHFLKHAYEVQFFSGLHFYTLSKALIACRAMQLRFLKVETLLNNAFKIWFAKLVIGQHRDSD